jgi:23S rRNA pseudouridine1911/1915/1917 synthase
LKYKGKEIEIIYQDDDIIVLNKPSGLLTIPDRFDKTQISLIELLKAEYEEVLVVHRLDRDTSGIMIFAKNATVHKFLNEKFQSQAIKKIYHAIVTGYFEQDELTINIPITNHPVKKGMMMASIKGKPSLSILKVLEKFRNTTLIEVNLVTGRQHQLRVHCSAIGHPLLVDSLYGLTDSFLLSNIKRRYKLKKHTEEKPVISRITMHSYSIEFEHPKTGEIVLFTAEYPKDLRATLQLLRKYSSL